MWKTRISSRGQLVLPGAIRQLDGIREGDAFAVERIEPGTYRLVREAPAANAGAVDWLARCPEKGYFTPVESESTDTL